MGRKAAEEDMDKILEFIDDADVVFLAGGLGGGTGSGALPVIARQLKQKDILTVGLVTKPFIFEGRRRSRVAQESLDLLQSEVDTLIVLPNQKLIDVVDQKVSLINAFSMINEVLNQFVRSISDIITKPGHINVDFADIKSVMKGQGCALIGTSRATGEDRATRAALEALSSPLLDNMKMKGVRGVLLNISGNADLGLHEMSSAASIVYEQAHEDASIVLGSVIDESLQDEVVVTIIATGFHEGPVEIKKTQPERTPSRHESTICEQKDHTRKERNDQDSIDLKDIDIPAVMRRMAQERENNF
jgi:cell division protein FtsZ